MAEQRDTKNAHFIQMVVDICMVWTIFFGICYVVDN